MRLGGAAIPKNNKRFLLLLIYLSILMLLTMITNFNLTGYNYHLNEETMMVTIKEGFVKKEVYDAQENVFQLLQVMLAINKANDMWLLTIVTLSLFLTVFSILFLPPLKPRKNVKLYAVISILLLTAFISWDAYVHKEIIEEISNALNKL